MAKKQKMKSSLKDLILSYFEKRKSDDKTDMDSNLVPTISEKQFLSSYNINKIGKSFLPEGKKQIPNMLEISVNHNTDDIDVKKDNAEYKNNQYQKDINVLAKKIKSLINTFKHQPQEVKPSIINNKNITIENKKFLNSSLHKNFNTNNKNESIEIKESNTDKTIPTIMNVNNLESTENKIKNISKNSHISEGEKLANTMFNVINSKNTNNLLNNKGMKHLTSKIITLNLDKINNKISNIINKDGDIIVPSLANGGVAMKPTIAQIGDSKTSSGMPEPEVVMGPEKATEILREPIEKIYQDAKNLSPEESIIAPRNEPVYSKVVEVNKKVVEVNKKLEMVNKSNDLNSTAVRAANENAVLKMDAENNSNSSQPIVIPIPIPQGGGGGRGFFGGSVAGGGSIGGRGSSSIQSSAAFPIWRRGMG